MSDNLFHAVYFDTIVKHQRVHDIIALVKYTENSSLVPCPLYVKSRGLGMRLTTVSVKVKLDLIPA